MKCLLVFVGGIFALVLLYIFSETNFVQGDIYDCQEEWYGSSIHESESPEKIKSCIKGDRPVNPKTDYYVSDGNAYRVNIKVERYDPSCSYGGGPGNMGQIFIPICWLPREWHRMHVSEHRRFWLISHDGDNFHTASTKQTALTSSQQNRLSHYVVDSDSVYYISEKIKGADQSTFEVIFPFDDDSDLGKYDFARDGKYLYIDGKQLPLVDLSAVKWLSIACRETYPRECKYPISSVPDIGVINKDIIYLRQWPQVALIRNVVTSEPVCFSKGIDVFCDMAGKHFLLKGELNGEVHFSQKGRD